MSEGSIRLTQYSHDTSCGCKVPPKVLGAILHSEQAKSANPNLLAGNETRDNAAIHDLGNNTSVISTADFSMPIVDNPFNFGRTMATNTISGTFAMGDKPIMAIAILGQPIDELSPEIVHEVTEDGRYAYRQAGIALVDGHSTNAPEPIFGLAITEIILIERVKRNSTTQAGYKLFLTKPLEIGVLTMTKKKSLLKPEHRGLAAEVMCWVNIIGASFANIKGVKTMTDVTGFGLLRHLSEMYQGADVQTCIDYDTIPKLLGVEEYVRLGVVPDGTERNFAGYGHLMGEMSCEMRDLLRDPQTSDGLLLVVMPGIENRVKAITAELGTGLTAIGELIPARGGHVMVETR